MLTLLLVSALAADVDTGASVALVGWSGSARHRVLPGATLWTSVDLDGWAFTAEGLWAHVRDATPHYVYDHHYGRLAGTFEWSVGSHATHFRAGAGPSLSLRTGTTLEWLPGVRTRIALHGPIGPLAWTWATGAVIRVRGVDYDASLGLGVRW